jgi:hypothetical protein
MISLEQYTQVAHRAVIDTAQAYHLQATTVEGLPLSVPCSYQILEPGFRPFRAGKASPQELQSELDTVLGQAEARGINAGIEGQEAIRKLSVQLGLGIDCSNFAYRCLTLLHERVGIGEYTDTVFRSAPEIRDLHASKESWAARDQDGNARPLSAPEAEKLGAADLLDTTWIASVFGKDPEFIIGSHHMSNADAAQPLHAAKVLPGDMIAFNKAGNGVVSHVAVVESTDTASDGSMHMDFWHAWHTRDFQSGLRRDNLQTDGQSFTWSHEGLADPTRYQGHFFCRPLGLIALTASLA